MEADERRTEPRFPIEGFVVVEDHTEKHPVKLLDISGGGLRFEAARSFPRETLIRVVLDYYPVDIPLRALVAWAKPGAEGTTEHGAEFVNLPRAETVLVKDFIEENRPEA